MANEDMPQVGDVITSPKFAFGFYNDESRMGTIFVDGETKEMPVGYSRTEEERVTHAAATGKILPKNYEVDLAAYDPGRGDAKFVVVSACMYGGSSSARPGDEYPDGWHIVAHRLDDAGEFESDSEIICFYMTGSFNYMVKLEDVNVVGKMQMRFS